jgi:hypothetical protein
MIASTSTAPQAENVDFEVWYCEILEDDAGIFELALDGFDSGCPLRNPAFELPCDAVRHSGHDSETTHAPFKSRSPNPALDRYIGAMIATSVIRAVCHHVAQFADTPCGFEISAGPNQH